MSSERRIANRAVSRSRRRQARPDAIERLECRQLLAAHILGSAVSYATIQSAVDAASPGAVINVDAGTYAELVVVHKTLTLRGAQAGIDARSNKRNTPTAESILIGFLYTTGKRSGGFRVTANNVTLDGFTVQSNNTNTGSCPAGIVLAPSIAGSRVLNNIIQNNMTGLFLSNNSGTKRAVIQHNVFLNNNASVPANNGGRGIYSDGEVSGGKLTNVLIDGNTFLCNNPSAGDKYQGGIALESRTANSQSNITITNNVFDGVGKVLFFNADHIDLQYNVVTHCLDQWSCGFRFEGGVSDVTIKYNTIYDNTGPGICVDSHGFNADNTRFVVQYNNLFNNDTAYGVKYSLAVNGDAIAGTFDARFNYWGAANGPSGQGPGSGDMAWGNAHYGSSTTSWTTVAGSELILSNWLNSPAVPIQTPYLGLAPTDGANIEAETYNHGGLGIAYNDTTAGNSGGRFRTGERADIEVSTDTGGGYDVASTAVGEWLKYTVNLTATGAYSIAFRVANAQTTAGKFHLEIDGVNVTGALSAPPTGGWQKWTTVTASNIQLTAGQHIARLVMDTAGSSGAVGNFNWFKFTTSAPIPPSAPASLTASSVSASQISLSWINTGSSAASNIANATTLPLLTTTYVSDLTAMSVTTGWGTVQKDKSVVGNALTLNGNTYAKGIGTHADRTITYNLGGTYTSFLSEVGVDDEVNGKGTASVVFQVWGDGILLFDSGTLHNGDPAVTRNVNVAGVQTLTLIAKSAIPGDIDYAHADWAGARLLG